MGNSDEGDHPPARSSSDELSSILQQALSRTPTAQPSFSPKKIVSSAEMFNRTFPLVPGGAVSYVAELCEEEGGQLTLMTFTNIPLICFLIFNTWIIWLTLC